MRGGEQEEQAALVPLLTLGVELVEDSSGKAPDPGRMPCSRIGRQLGCPETGRPQPLVPQQPESGEEVGEAELLGPEAVSGVKPLVREQLLRTFAEVGQRLEGEGGGWNGRSPSPSSSNVGLKRRTVAGF